jgi:hypothetical protein
LKLDVAHTRHGITDHGIAIRDFDLAGDWLPEHHRWSTPGKLPSRAVAKLVRDYPAAARLMRVHESTQVGHDPTLLQQPAGARLRGYYQSWRIVSTALDYGAPRRPHLRTPGDWALDLAERAEREAPIIVHVRRGDYAKVDGFGLLGRDYYSAGIERLRLRGVDGAVWVFSDEPAAAAKIVAGEMISGGGSAAEEMWVMSHGAGHVIANSTFSWWAAWMNNPRIPVVAPSLWFQDGPVVDGLIPPEWDRIDSVWE